jgi:hypothetical protein
VRIAIPHQTSGKRIWRLWKHYYVLGPAQVYENEFVSQVHRQRGDD